MKVNGHVVRNGDQSELNISIDKGKKVLDDDQSSFDEIDKNDISDIIGASDMNDEVFVVDLAKNDKGLGLGLIDGLVCSKYLLTSISQGFP